jgi:hypothetical protein
MNSHSKSLAVNLQSFFGELKRRHVYKVAFAYAIVAWLLIQIATQVFPFFAIPNWVIRFVVVIMVLGFPIALVIAWAFELTSHGLKRAENVGPSESIRRWSTRKFAAVMVSIAMVAAALLIFQLVRSRSIFPEQITAASAFAQKSIAVLPLLNESGKPEDEYFSDGLSEELIAALAQIKELKVIGAALRSILRTRKRTAKP